MSSPSTGPGGAKLSRDLRQDLIAEGIRILDEDGLEGLTLRRVAAAAGVSHAAPAHHFRGLPDLLAQICKHGFADLAQSMADRREAAAPGPRAKLIAICEGYIAFAKARPALIQLMFGARNWQSGEDIWQAGEAAYQILRDACAPFEPVGPQEDSTETLVWSLVHGLAFLDLGGRFDNPLRATPSPDIADILPPLPLRRPGAAR